MNVTIKRGANGIDVLVIIIPMETPTPSPEDIQMTERLTEAGLGIPLSPLARAQTPTMEGRTMNGSVKGKSKVSGTLGTSAQDAQRFNGSATELREKLRQKPGAWFDGYHCGSGSPVFGEHVLRTRHRKPLAPIIRVNFLPVI